MSASLRAETATSASPTDPQAAVAAGLSCHRQGRLDEARAHYHQALRADPGQVQALHFLGISYAQAQQPDLALPWLEQACQLAPAEAPLHYSLGNVLSDLGQHEAAVAAYQTALQHQPGWVAACNNLGLAWRALGRHGEALAAFEQALQTQPTYAVGHNHKGLTLVALGQTTSALPCYEQALQLNPRYAEAHANLASALDQLGQHDDARAHWAQAVQWRPQDVQARLGLARNGLARRQAGEAVATLEPLLSQPAVPDAVRHLLGVARLELGDYAGAIALLEPLREATPPLPFLLGELAHARLQSADWAGLDGLRTQIEAGLRQRQPTVLPFTALSLTDDPAWQRQAAELFLAHEYPAWLPAVPERPAPRPRASRTKVRLAYLSADFHLHATTHLMAELFELHDRQRFELIALSYGPRWEDPARQRLRAAFDQFWEVDDLSDPAIAQRARALGVDIAIDLKGFTTWGRPGIFLHRAAPLQVSYLGYPGTWGHPVMDYVIADRHVIPPQARDHFSEKVVYLPHSYQVNDRQRAVSTRQYARADCQLPPQGLVFCCFNNTYKISPETFTVWMRILQRCPGSVLWLLEDNPHAQQRLQAAAQAQGVAPERLVFAPRWPSAEHLARQTLADLVLDTFTYNAHTTASDALRAGVPVLTCPGASFASRVAASLNAAVGLQALNCASPADYEAEAVALAQQPERLQGLKQHLREQGLQAPLFDSPRFTRDLEAAYLAMLDRQDQGLPPSHLALPPT
ncbi:tetratricopeptide repeat protein [Curvibacter sp. HBC61]|uniref:protein O-GlcNAc transferase n=1 Tax=Curvibacter cyanobacteriorum TaxID=3026422 RepID=A0ABT5MX48_9BURK|nr:glycosyltransferase family 41 protein [Curvibacter sp. HBC61]MDD0838653.1 tetratricopeptide repeat protein [Curvibacter sp. HBC61]